MAPFSPIPRRHPIRVVLSSTALQPFVSVGNAAALAIAQLGVAAFFISGITRAFLGDTAGWFVLAAAVLAAFARAIDLLKTVRSEAERSKAVVYMQGLADLRKEWAGRRRTE